RLKLCLLIIIRTGTSVRPIGRAAHGSIEPWRTPWSSRSQFGVAGALNAGFLGVCSETGLRAAPVACGLPPGDLRAKIILPCSIQCRRLIGVRFLPDTRNRCSLYLSM